MKKKTAGSKNYMSCGQNWFLNSITSFNIFGANHSLERIFSVSDAEGIRSDWENVGLDLRTAMEICYKNEKEQGKVL